MAKANTKHGAAPHRGYTKLYNTWLRMKGRCNRPTATSYQYYGGRGISVCDAWQHDFQAFRDWALANGYREGLSIDRIDVNGNYCPENCRWITMAEQQRNKRNVPKISWNGETHTLTEWADILGIKYGTLWKRLHDGMTIDEAFTK